MARAIPTYQRQVLGTSVQSAPVARSNVSASDPVADALAGVGQQIGQGLGAVALAQQREIENRAAVDVSNLLSEGEVYWQEDYTRRAQSWGPGDPDLREGIAKDFDSWVSESEQKLPTESARRYFRTHANQLKTRLQTSAFAHQERVTTETLNAQTAAGVQADENLVYNDPSRFDEVFARRMEPMLARTDLTDAQKIEMADAYRRQLSLAVERGQMERDPVGWYRDRFGEEVTGQDIEGVTGPARASEIANAIYGQESSSGAADTSFVNDQGVTGPMQIQRATFDGMKRLGIIQKEFDWRDPEDNKEAGFRWVAYLTDKYNGDPAKVAAAYYGGEKAVAADGSIKRDMRNVKHPDHPTVGEYVDQVLARMGRSSASVSPTAPKTFRSIDWEQQSALRAQAETKIKQGDARFRAEADAAVRDAVAMHKNGILDPDPLPPEFFMRAYGEQGPAAYAQYQKSREMGADIASFKTLSLAEITAQVERNRPVPGAGFAADEERYRTVVAAAQHVLKQRAEDPAGYAVANNAELAGLLAQVDDPATPADQRPALLQRYVRDSLAEQQRLGITQPRVLTPAQADAIARRSMTASRPEDSANLIAGLEAEYGGYFPQVFSELVRDKKIAGELLIIPNLPTQTAREAVSRLARVKEADLVQGIEATDQKTVKEEVTAVLEDFARAVPLMTEQAAGVVNAYETTLRKLAYQFIASGESPTDAVDHANELLLGQYEFDGTMRIPAAINRRAVKRGAAARLRDDLDGIDLPMDLTGSRNDDELRDEWLSTVRARPLWFTTDDDGGLELWAQGNNGVRYRVSREGVPVSYTWEQLMAEDADRIGRLPRSAQEAFEMGDTEAYDDMLVREQLNRRFGVGF